MYVEFMTPEYIGFFFLLENAEEPELRIWWVKPEPLEFVSIPIRLGNWTLQGAVKKANEYARRYSRSSQTYEDHYLTEAVNIIIYVQKMPSMLRERYDLFIHSPERPNVVFGLSLQTNRESGRSENKLVRNFVQNSVIPETVKTDVPISGVPTGMGTGRERKQQRSGISL